MSEADNVLVVSDDLPLRVDRPVHSGKVRSVYWLGDADSLRLIETRGYRVPAQTRLAIMVISDRLSAFDCLWRSESLPGVPGKGATLNAIAAHAFSLLDEAGLPGHHLLEMPHPMLWVVRQARPVRIEAIARRYLTGSLWRAYQRGERVFGGQRLAEGLTRYARLPSLLFTPSTKGVVRGLEGVPETDDAPIDSDLLRRYLRDFGFRTEGDLERCEVMLRMGFEAIDRAYGVAGDLLVDTKFEFGYAPGYNGAEQLIVMDEVGTPDSSRVWAKRDWEEGAPREYSKEQFREALMDWVPDREVLLDSVRMPDRKQLARDSRLPDALFEALSRTYAEAAERFLGRCVPLPERPRERMLDLLNEQFALLR